MWLQAETVALASSPLETVNLASLMQATAGSAEITIGLIDGPVADNHPGLATESIRSFPTSKTEGLTQPNNTSRAHGTYIAGILSARRGSVAPAICPECTLMVRPIFLDSGPGQDEIPTATADELANAIIDCVNAGANVLNLSVAVAQLSPNRELDLDEALRYAAIHEVFVVAAAGNQGSVGGSPITRHPWVVPVAACDAAGRPAAMTNLGNSIARHGLMAPGAEIVSLGVEGQPVTSGGTSAAAPFVTGTIALLWSAFPKAAAAQVKSALLGEPRSKQQTGIAPPLLNAWQAYHTLAVLS